LRNIILQHFDGELRELDKLSIANIQRYAAMVGAEYKLVTGKPFNKNLTAPCQKVHMLNQMFDTYDTVLMLDIDMFAPKGMNENVFNLPGVGLYHTVQQEKHTQLVRLYGLLGNINAPYWGGAIYKMDRPLRQKLREDLKTNTSWMLNFSRPYHFEDEGIMHVLANKAGIKPEGTYLDPKWCQCSFLPNPEKAGFIHIRTKITPQGPKREKIENYKALVNSGIIE
jgi:hypothetical protein